MNSSKCFKVILLLLVLRAGCLYSKNYSEDNKEKYNMKSAQSMIRTSENLLKPVYCPLAKQIAADFNLSNKTGIGIDIGSGPGALIIELCKYSKLHWINADINPNFFSYFYDQAEKAGFVGRVSAIFADAEFLPFRDNYADIIISRGCYHFWADKEKAFAEIYRVLKPEAVAFIGRGFAENMPIEIAQKIRAKQGRKMKYSLEAKADELKKIMAAIDCKNYKIRISEIAVKAGINYGIWIEFHKPAK